MPLGPPKSGTLGTFNVGLAASVGEVIPLGGQVDLLIASGLGPFQQDLSSQLNAALAASANLTVSIANPYAGIQSVLASLGNIQAALAQALTLPQIPGEPTVQYSTQLSAVTALASTLGAQLGALQQSMDLANQVKTAALSTATELTGSINAGPAFFFDFNDTLGAAGAQIASLFSGGLVDGTNVILPTQQVYGVVLLSSMPSVQTALSAIIKAP